ncbi:MAG: adenylate/guanylate cyclase domain-containing protein [Polyangiales bacterium]
MPELMIKDDKTLRRDYERLRASFEISQAIGAEHDVDLVLREILKVAFRLLPADRGVVLLNESGHLQAKSVRFKDLKEEREGLSISQTIIDEVMRHRAAVLSRDASVDERFQKAKSVISSGIRSTMGVPLLHNGDVFGVMLLDSKIETNAFTEKDLRLFQTIANQAATVIQNIEFAHRLQGEAITRQRFQRLLSPAIAEQVLRGDVDIKRGGEMRPTTVLFCDIRGFTQMSENFDAQQVVTLLNEYFESMVEIVFEHEGTLDKFIGDEIMALFGAPVGHPDDPCRAVLTALKMKDALIEFNRQKPVASMPDLEVGTGINTGEVVAGYIGSSRAMEYTVVGDAVNIASRLCSIAKPGQVLISESTANKLGGRFILQEIDDAQIRGKRRPIRVFNVIGELST